MTKELHHSGNPGHADPHAQQKPASTGFYLVQVALPSAGPQAVPLDTVVKAKDEAEAEAKSFKELGIVSVDRTANFVAISPAAEIDFIRSQARRLGVDLRSQKDAEGKLTWAPEGHKAQKTYYVSATGELSDKKPEEQG